MLDDSANHSTPPVRVYVKQILQKRGVELVDMRKTEGSNELEEMKKEDEKAVVEETKVVVEETKAVEETQAVPTEETKETANESNELVVNVANAYHCLLNKQFKPYYTPVSSPISWTQSTYDLL